MTTTEYIEGLYRRCPAIETLGPEDIDALAVSIEAGLRVPVRRGDAGMHVEPGPVCLIRDGRLCSAAIYVGGPHFEHREAVFFGPDGQIELCPWADSENAAPFIEAFAFWLETWLRA